MRTQESKRFQALQSFFSSIYPIEGLHPQSPFMVQIWLLVLQPSHLYYRQQECGKVGSKSGKGGTGGKDYQYCLPQIKTAKKQETQ